ncbi:MAG: hypothetical protein SF162_00415 [bacterium]|nr:hypothetical protein [bacterium]
MPTATLILASATPSPTLPPPTPEQTAAPEVTIEAASTLAPTARPASTRLEDDPLVAELIFIAQRLAADETGLPTRRIRLESIEAIIWRDSSLGCPVPEQVVTQVETPGYRIVLAAGDSTFLFHTDIDRVIPCDPANEILPDRAEATEESP